MLKKIIYVSLMVVSIASCSAPTTTGSTPLPSGSPANNTTDTDIVSKGLTVNINPGSTDSNVVLSPDIALTVDRFGKDNKAISFNGTSNSIKVNVSNLKNLAVSLWFKAPYNAKAYPTLFSYGEEIFHVHLFGGTVYGAKTGGLGDYGNDITGDKDRLTNRYAIELEPNYFDSNWHHLYSSYDRDNNKMQLFIDNTLKGEKTIDKDLLSSNYIEFGHSSANAPTESWYKGEMSDIKIYNRGLTVDEISKLYNEGK